MREIGAQMTELLCHSIKNHRELRPGSAPLGKAFLAPVERRARNPYLRFLGHPRCARAHRGGRREEPIGQEAIRPIDRGDVDHRHGMPLELPEETDRD